VGFNGTFSVLPLSKKFPSCGFRRASRFQSRQSWGRQVAYGLQFEAWNYRALNRARDIRYRLGGRQYLPLDGFQPAKPKGTHWRTYNTQLERAEAYEMKCDLYQSAFCPD
jgi:hypothetical protein